MKGSKLYYGSAYYPEAWPNQSIENELDKMLEIGLNTVRVGEFAWSTMEPKKDHYDLSLFRRVVSLAKERDMSVIMCTPTACPPIWMVKEDSGVLFTNRENRRLVHGARRNVCLNNKTFIERSKRIVEALSKEFKDDENIIGWQIDNELIIGDSWGGCRCSTCIQEYQKYLEERYGSIEKLNEEWNTYVWSIEFQHFDEVLPPSKDIWNHPSAISTWGQYQNKLYNDFIKMQVDIIKNYSKASVSTDQVPLMGLSYDDVSKNVDMIQFNHYNDESTLWRLGMWCDYVRSFKEKPFWITETSPNWNGSEYANYSRPKNWILANIMFSVIQGAELNAYWLWRAHLGGHELMHGSIIDSYGRPAHNIEEISKLGSDMNKLSPYLCQTKVSKNEIAVHFNYLADNLLTVQSIVPEFKYQDAIEKWIYKPLSEAHIKTDFIGASHSLDEYKVLISPFTACLDEYNLPSKIEKFVKDGGTWIVLPLTDLRTQSGRKYKESAFGHISKLTSIELCHLFPKGEIYNVKLENGKIFVPKDVVYYDLESGINASILAKFQGGYLDNKPAIIQESVGKGRIIMLGFIPEEKDLVEILGKFIGNDSIQASANVIVTNRNGKYDIFQAIEISNKEGEVVIPYKSHNILTGEQYEENQIVKLGKYEYLFAIKD